MGARKVVVNAFPRMVHFLKSNGPWEQLVSEQNIQLNVLNESPMRLADQLSVIPLRFLTVMNILKLRVMKLLAQIKRPFLFLISINGNVGKHLLRK